MKTSTIMIITAVLVTLGSLTAFNINVKKVYLTGAYKSRFRDMDFTPLKGIENLDIQNADQMRVSVEYGTKEGIWISKSVKDQITTNTDQHTLKIKLSENRKDYSGVSWGQIIIITRKISKVSSSSHPHLHQGNTYDIGQISISGYQEGDLDLQIAEGVSFNIGGAKLNTLNANIGDKKNGEASLYIDSASKINSALFNIPGKSTLNLEAPNITKVTYNLSDSATVTLSGKLVQMIK